MTVCEVCGKTNSDDARFCFSCGTTLTPAAPPVKVDIKSPLTYPTTPSSPPIHSSRQAPRAGSCYYHTDLPSTYVCARCGRSICVGCTRQYGMLTFCTECYWGLAPKIGYMPEPYQQPPYGYQQQQGRSLF